MFLQHPSQSQLASIYSKSRAPDYVSNCTERALRQTRTPKTGRQLGEVEDLWLALEIVIFLFIHCEETTLQLGEDERSDEEFVYIRGLEESRTCELSPANLPCCVFVLVYLMVLIDASRLHSGFLFFFPFATLRRRQTFLHFVTLFLNTTDELLLVLTIRLL